MFIKPVGKIATGTVIALSVIGSTPNIGGAYAAPAISVQLDDVPLKFDAAPRIDKGVTYVPFRTVGEAQGDEYRLPAAASDITPQSNVADAADQQIQPQLMVYALDGNGELTKVLSDSKKDHTSGTQRLDPSFSHHLTS
ncbi:hypothetical protein [Paenibacillus sp. PAMC 26794]|uniref:hypothetical protein n=1 Tax=Paenibacillus sp. PAMC 26794 TaxID=1257080 RepID=UPI0002E20232|nr:hypothetical protein [Paenibacillus sp. PAMC 26794]